MEIKTKGERLAKRFNEITAKIAESVQNADDLMVDADEITTSVDEIIEELPEDQAELDVSEIINLKNLLEDFKYVRQTLKETTDRRTELTAA